MTNYTFFGDIHGDFDKLEKLIKLIPFESNLVFLGDYINYGSQSKEVVQFLIDLNQKRKCTFLVGNHEYRFLQYLEKEIKLYDLNLFGGFATIKSYLGNQIKGNVLENLKDKIPPNHMQFFKNLKPYIETKSFFASHSGLNCDNPNSRELDDLINNSHLKCQLALLSKPIICGHFVQENYEPYITENLICLDTGCGKINGPLTAISFANRAIVSVV